MNKYKLINIDTLESVMCDKINDHYVSNCFIKINDWILMPDFTVKQLCNNSMSDYLDSQSFGTKKLIATTNTSLQCPQVVDYVEELANDYLRTGCSFNPNDTNAEKYLKTGYIYAIYDHLETHSMSDEEVLEFGQWLLENDATMEKPKEYLLTMFKSQQPIKVYYK